MEAEDEAVDVPRGCVTFDDEVGEVAAVEEATDGAAEGQLGAVVGHG